MEEDEPHEGSLVSTSSHDTPTPTLHSKPPSGHRIKKDQKGLAFLKLIVEDGPLSHISRAKTLGEAWLTLKSLFDKEGFSAIFILIKKFTGLSVPRLKLDHISMRLGLLLMTLRQRGFICPRPLSMPGYWKDLTSHLTISRQLFISTSGITLMLILLSN